MQGNENNKFTMTTQKDIRDIRGRVDALDKTTASLQEEVRSGFKYIGKELDDLKNNHVHTVEEEVKKLRIGMARMTTRLTITISIAVFIITIIVNVAFVLFVK